MATEMNDEPPGGRRVIAFIDGMNLYHGLLDLNPQKGQRHDRRFLWIDLPKLMKKALLPGQELVRTNYYTALRQEDPSSVRRQKHYLNALGAIHGPEFVPYFGRFQRDDVTCNDCGRTWIDYEEKKSDVNLAVGMLLEADQFDTAILVTGDSDLIPPVEAVCDMGKRVVVASIASRRSEEFMEMSRDESIEVAERRIWEKQLKQCRMPETFMANTQPFRRPSHWQ